MKILINLVTSICLITLIALFEYNKINSIIFVVLSILCLILNFSLKKNEKCRHVRYRAGRHLVRYSYEIGGVSRK